MTPQANNAVPVFAPVEQPEIWLSIKDVAAVLSYADGAGKVGLREIQNRVDSGEYASRISAERHRNGKVIREVPLSALPQDARSRFIASRSDGELAVAIVGEDEALPPAPTRMRGAAIPLTEDGTVDVVALRAAGRNTEADTGVRRLQIVCQCRAELASVAATAGRMAKYEQLGGRFGESPATLRRWVRQFAAHGDRALFPAYGSARGSHRSIPENLGRAILASYRNPQRQTVKQIMEYTVAPWCTARRLSAPNRTSVARFLKSEVFAAERIAFRDGKRAWQEQVMLKVRRDPGDLAVNEMWCADHRRFDFFVQTPDGVDKDGRPKWRAFRPWLTTYIDLASADFTGWCICETPNSQSVALALHAGILKRGVPQYIYHDNGKEFTAKRFGGKARLHGLGASQAIDVHNPRAEDLADRQRWPAGLPPMLAAADGLAVLAQIGIERVIHALPYSSWSKPIEPMFGAFHRAFENMLPGYCGNSTAHRPEKLKRELAQHTLLYWNELPNYFMAFLTKWRSVPHGRHGHERPLSPDQFYERAGNSVRRASESALDMLLLETQPRTVQTDGIEVAGKLFLDSQLSLMVREKVFVRYDPNDLTHIVVRPVANPAMRFVVAQMGTAQWHRQTEVNDQIRHMRRQQREHLKVVSSEDREHRILDAVDPVGANLNAVQNAMDIRAREAGFELEPIPLTDKQAMKSEQQADKREEKASQASHKAAVAASASDVFAQAKRESAWRSGESAG